MSLLRLLAIPLVAVAVLWAPSGANARTHAPATPGVTPRVAADDSALVAALDERYQAAVKANDADAMEAILAPDFILVTGRGSAFTRSQLVQQARTQVATFTHQEDTQRTVRLYGETAVVTALLWEQGVQGGQSFDKKLWFSDVYMRTPGGWRYVFGQASLAMPGGA